MTTRRFVIVGAGGFAREVRWLLEELNASGEGAAVMGYVVSDLSRLSDQDSKDEVLGDYSWLRAHRGEFDALTLGIGTPASRLKVASELLGEFGEDLWPALIHPSVRLHRPSARIGPGVQVCAGVVGTVNVSLHAFAMVNLACTLGHECVIGRGSVLNPTVNISGGVVIEEGCLVGTGSQVLQYLVVGKGSTIGGGSVVTKDVPPGQTVVGAPAKPLQRRA